MKTLIAAAALIASVTAASAQQQQQQTVESLLREGYFIVGVVPSNAGPGIFLRKNANLIACFVSETPNSTEIKTSYCKPVR